MNIKRIECLKEFLTEQMNHWMLFPLALTVMGICGKYTGIRRPGLLLWVLCGLFPFACFLMRCKVRRFYLFALLQFGTAGGILLLVSRKISLGGIICLCAVFAYSLHSIFVQLKRDNPYTEPMQLPVGVGISAGAILLQHYQGTDEWDAYYSAALIGAVALFFIIFYLQRYLDFLSVNKSSAGYLPASEMFRSGLGLALGYTLCGAVLLAVVAHLKWFTDFLAYVKEQLMRFLRFLFSKMPKGELEEPQPMAEKGMDISLVDGLPREEPFWLWEILWQAVEFAVIAAVLFIAARTLIRFLRWLQGYLAQRRPREDVEEEDAFDVRERCGVEKTQERKKQNLLGGFSHRERIRKLYRRKLLSASARMPQRERNRLEYDTAREWESKLDAEGMAAVYERARYSDREVTGADVRRMKEACR